MEQIAKWLYFNLNGPTETSVLFLFMLIDTVFANTWRRRRGVAITSGGGLGGLIKSIPLALMPVIIWSFEIPLSVAPDHIAGLQMNFNPMIFDLIAFSVFVLIGWYWLKSILANAKLAGYDIPNWLEKYIEDEYHIKLGKIETEPNSAKKDQKQVSKTYGSRNDIK
ncbi:phage holin family protein [Weissella kandleri]|uniref:phage holin family protein n=1 Tax=Weissella kandleri TaxID=1616 RepID=UPI00070A70B5|nr:phage holin family protein [Weissella kandleri]